MFVLEEGEWLADAMDRVPGLKKTLRGSKVPIIAGFPFPPAIETLPMHLPLPATIRTELLEPIEVDEDPERAGDQRYVQKIHAEVESRSGPAWTGWRPGAAFPFSSAAGSDSLLLRPSCRRRGGCSAAGRPFVGIAGPVARRTAYPAQVGLWFPRPATTPDERVSFKAVANTFRGRRSIGGEVTVTDRRLLFMPNRLDGLIGAPRLSVERGDIRRVWMEEPGRAAVRERGLGAAIRPQVGIEHPAGPTFITVHQPQELIRALRDAAR